MLSYLATGNSLGEVRCDLPEELCFTGEWEIAIKSVHIQCRQAQGALLRDVLATVRCNFYMHASSHATESEAPMVTFAIPQNLPTHTRFYSHYPVAVDWFPAPFAQRQVRFRIADVRGNVDVQALRNCTIVVHFFLREV